MKRHHRKSLTDRIYLQIGAGNGQTKITDNKMEHDQSTDNTQVNIKMWHSSVNTNSVTLVFVIIKVTSARMWAPPRSLWTTAIVTHENSTIKDTNTACCSHSLKLKKCPCSSRTDKLSLLLPFTQTLANITEQVHRPGNRTHKLTSPWALTNLTFICKDNESLPLIVQSWGWLNNPKNKLLLGLDLTVSTEFA